MRAAPWLLAPAVLFAGAGEDLFEAKIRPVLVEKCQGCHNAKLKPPMGGLRVDSAEALRKGGDTGPALVPGDPSKSLLLKAIRYDSLELKMPPTGKLDASVIADFTRWIELGAPDPRAASVSAAAPAAIDLAKGREFWSFRPVKPVAPPYVKNAAWAKTPVDRFLLAKLEEKGLAPAPPAGKREWIRRVTFDLTGLPPAPRDIDAYLADQSIDADRRVVERLLASPHYGERWARHWLDLVRFAETNGHEFDNNKLDAWQYRDYVIRAFNDDVPYDQFVREHIAGDLLAKPRLSRDGRLLESPLGAGAYWFGEVLNSATDSVKARADAVDNQIDVFGKAFLGLTIACARCHDHKFDPIPTADYYSLAGYMHSTYVRETVVDSPARRREIAAAIDRVRTMRGAVERPSSARLRPRDGDTVFEDFTNGYAAWDVSGQAFGAAPVNGVADSHGGASHKLVGSLTSRKFVMPELFVHVLLAAPEASALKEEGSLRVTLVADDHKSQHFFGHGRHGFQWRTIRMTKEIGRECYFEIVDRDRAGSIAVDAIVISKHKDPPPLETPAVAAPRMPELDVPVPESAWGMTSKDDAPRDVKVHIRGSHKNLGADAPRRFLQVIVGADQPRVAKGSGREGLAEWMASPRNPLTARVMVNRVWKHHFGAGLVRTPDNFGKTGDRPTHPELLDWLAAEFVRSGWSVKEMHRRMVLSNAYKMSSRASAESIAADPRNELLSHMPVRRLEAEAIRDALLYVSGALDPAMHGPSVAPHISAYQDGRGKPKSGPLDGDGRRSIYVQVRRNFLTPMFLAFDYPPPISSIGARGASAVPSQALLMMNNELVAECARAWADRAMAAEPDAARRVERMYAAAFARPPEEWETREALAFVADGDPKQWADLAHVLFNSAEFIHVQ